MAPENKKRKSAPDSAAPPKKLKKSDEVAAAAKPAKSDKKKESKKEDSAVKAAKAPRKRASDFFDAENADATTEKKTKKSKKNKDAEVEPVVEEPEAVEEEEKPKKKSDKKAKKAKETEEKDEEPVPTSISAAGAKDKKSKKSKKAKEPEPVAEEASDAEEVFGESSDEDEEVDDQTAALLKGFDSDEDDEDVEDDGIAIEDVPAIPDDKKMKKKLSKAGQNDDDEPGVIYVGRIPHGFYEHQMRAYFAQFGEITRLRLSRNRRTGRSKHYAFVEFRHGRVADIVAETMDKYLMFGHILQVRRLAPAQVHAHLFKGANRRFKAVPWARIEARRLRLGVEREHWDRRVKKEESRRKSKLGKLKAAGIEYDFEPAPLKSVEQVPRKSAKAVVDEKKAAAEEEQQKLLKQSEEEKPETLDSVLETTVEKKAGKETATVTEKVKVKKGKKTVVDKEVAAEVPVEAEKPKAKKVGKKSKRLSA